MSGKNQLILPPEDYYYNKARLEEWEAQIVAAKAMNEAAKRQHDLYEADLQRKVEEGEQAR
jgi:hypothetical protein